MIPPIVMGLRAGGVAVQVTDEKMKRFLQRPVRTAHDGDETRMDIKTAWLENQTR